jgi:cation diffusion facilitator family transporter
MATEPEPAPEHGAEAHGTRAILAAFAANLGIALMKLFAFVVTGSGAMLAEGVHSIADSGNQGLLLLGNRKSTRTPDEAHPFGYGRERFFWAFVVSMVLFSVGALFSIFDGIEKLRSPHSLDSPTIAVGVLLGAMVLEGLSFRTALREGRPLKGSSSWWRFIRLAKNPEIPILLLEDLAALIGLSLALAAVVLADVTGNPDFDAYGSLGIGALLAVVAVILAVEMRSLLIGESATPEVQRRIIGAIESSDGVRKIIHMRTEHLGPEDLLVAAKIEFDLDLTIRELADVIDGVERAVRAEVPEARMIFIEPDVMRSGVPDSP